MMYNSTKKAATKIILLIMAMVLVFGLLGGCSNDTQTEESEETVSSEETTAEETAEETTEEAVEEASEEESSWLVDEETTISILMPEHASYPVKDYDESPFLQYITELTNIKLDLMVIPDTDDAYDQKLNIMLSSTDMTDIIWSSADDDNINMLAVKGMFVAYTQNLDSTPNISTVLDENEDIVKTYAASDGELYIMPRLTLNLMTEIYIAREDLIEEQGLEQPTDYDDLYEMLVSLHEAYPDMQVWVNRWGAEHIITRLAYSWGSGYVQDTNGFYLNQETDEYVYGPAEETFKEMVVWLKKLYDEGLLDENYALMSTAEWEEAFATENALFSIDYIARIELINTEYINADSSARIVAINPPTGPTGQQGIYGRLSAMSDSGIVICADSEVIDASLKFVDWIYSDEGRYVATYGIEGETYTVDEDGYPALTEQMSRQANPDGLELISDFGWVYYLNKYEFPEGFLQATEGDPEEVDDRYMYSRAVMEDIGAVITPDPVLSYTDEQTKIIASNATDIRDYFKQNIDKFIMGTRPIEEWDDFVEEVMSLGVEEVAAVYNEAYETYKSR